MGTFSNIDDGLYCMFMNKMEIVDAVVNELEMNAEYYDDEYDNAVDMICAACDELGYNYNDLSKYDMGEICRRMGWN